MYYAVTITQEATPTGPLWILEHPELTGCRVEADVFPTAVHQLDEARIDWIRRALLSGQPVPRGQYAEPQITVTNAGGGQATWRSTVMSPQ